LQGVRRDSKKHGNPKETQEIFCAHRSADLPHASSEAHFARQFVLDFPENLQVQENKAVMRDVPQNYKLQDVASCKKSRQAKCTDTQRKRAKVSAPVARQTFPVHPSRFVLHNWHFGRPLSLKAYFVRGFPQKVEVVKPKLPCEPSFKN
jgi:hypothetical protein